MKKKVLLVSLMVMLFVCLFVISASAATYGESNVYYFDSSVEELATKQISDAMFTSTRDANDIITSYSGAFPKTNANGDAISWYKTGQETVNGNIYVSVSSFVTTDSNYCTINASSGMYKFITANGPTKQNIVSINFPNNANIKSFSDGSAYGLYAQTGNYKPANTELLFAYFPNTWKDTNRIVQATTVLEVYFDVNAPIDQINGQALKEGQMNETAFHSCKSLRKIVFPKTLVTIKDGGNGYGCMFDCDNMTNVVFPEGTPLKHVGLYAFGYCESLTEIVLPNTVETIEDRAFEGCANLIKLNLGASVKSLIGQSMTYISPKIQYFYVPNTITQTSGSHIFTNQGGSDGLYSVVFFAGTHEEAKALNDLMGSNNNQKFYTSDYSNMIEWNSTISDDEYVQKATNDKKYYVVYGYNTCKAFYEGIHELDPDKSNACAGICANCHELSLSANPVHVEKVVITFTDLTKIGTKVTTCDNANCPYHVSEDIPAVFTYVGISADMATHQFVTVGYLINQDSLNTYMSTLENGVAFSYGFVATATTADTAINGTPISAETGAVTASNMVQINLSVQEDIEKCSAFDFKMAGDFTLEKYLNANLGIALYTMTRTTSAGVDTYTVKYLGESGESATLTSFTFAEKITQGEE